MIYFDNAATTRVSEEVITDIIDSLRNDWANPSSISEAGMTVRGKIEHARKQVADYINADPEEIIFTGSGSEANNLAIKGFLEADENYRFECLLSTKIEHPSVYNICKEYRNKGYNRVEFMPIGDSGVVNIGDFRETVSELSDAYYCLVSVMMANNEIGTVQPIKALCEITHEHQGVFHTDATQAFGKIPIDVKALDVDLMSVSLHKVGLPKGIGFLYKKKGIKLSPIINGGHQENGMRAGTENTAYIIAAGNQVERLSRKEYPNHHIINYLFNKIYDSFMTKHIFYYNGALSEQSMLPNLMSLTFANVNAEALITLMDMKGVQVSAGSACSAGDKEPSRVLKAIGLYDELAFGTIRISIEDNATQEECDEFVRILGECLESLKMVGGE